MKQIIVLFIVNEDRQRVRTAHILLKGRSFYDAVSEILYFPAFDRRLLSCRLYGCIHKSRRGSNSGAGRAK